MNFSFKIQCEENLPEKFLDEEVSSSRIKTSMKMVKNMTQSPFKKSKTKDGIDMFNFMEINKEK